MLVTFLKRDEPPVTNPNQDFHDKIPDKRPRWQIYTPKPVEDQASNTIHVPLSSKAEEPTIPTTHASQTESWLALHLEPFSTYDFAGEDLRESGLEGIAHYSSPPTISIASDNTAISLEELNRRVVQETLWVADCRRHRLQKAFNNRIKKYGEDLRHHDKAVGDGLDESRSDFDRKYLNEVHTTTAALIEAEKQYDRAQEIAHLLGVVGHARDQESHFVDDPNDGYRLSEEMDVASTNAMRPYVEIWSQQVVYYVIHGMDDTEGRSKDIGDEWSVRSISLFSSISTRDQTRNRRRIDCWRAMCDKTREAL
jgi:hypothetical protein